ncbi:uncharacterized protein A4U43_C08F31780 [Asparagus officinalis]|nr:uncharacterized protein A4U43_C08F31780 [Asparagus officinalis]
MTTASRTPPWIGRRGGGCEDKGASGLSWAEGARDEGERSSPVGDGGGEEAGDLGSAECGFGLRGFRGAHFLGAGLDPIREGYSSQFKRNAFSV